MADMVVPPALLARVLRFCSLMLDHPNTWVKVIGSRDMQRDEREQLLRAIGLQATNNNFTVTAQYRPDDVYVCRVDDAAGIKPPKTDGQVCYEAFRHHCGYPFNWDTVREDLQDAWEFAAEQIKRKESLNRGQD